MALYSQMIIMFTGISPLFLITINICVTKTIGLALEVKNHKNISIVMDYIMQIIHNKKCRTINNEMKNT